MRPGYLHDLAVLIWLSAVRDDENKLWIVYFIIKSYLIYKHKFGKISIITLSSSHIIFGLME